MRPGMRSFSLGELVERLGGELVGDRAIAIVQVAPLDAAEPEHISFLGRDAFRAALDRCRAGAVILPPGLKRAHGAYVTAADPHAYFVRVAVLLNPEPEARAGVHPMAWIHPQAEVAASAEVGAFVTVAEGAVVGERVRLGPGCRVGAHARIGDDSNLHANVSVYAHCVVGKRAVMNAGCVIGADGFGGAWDGSRWLKMPHIGRVLIGDDVEIGANTTIDRGAMADTVIEDGVKLDNQIQVGHNVHIGAGTSIAGCAGIAGSAHIGARCVIGGAAMVTGHLRLADGVQISVGTVVTRSIDKPGRYSGIYPLSEHRAWLKNAVRLRRLGELEAPADTQQHGSANRTEETDDNANR
jgi:UDP-3-O-[3-hydroxymyristoyl] glucosamine N-acyltransferase